MLLSSVETFSIDFAGPFPIGLIGGKNLLTAVKHLTGWPIARCTKHGSSDVVRDFVQEEMIFTFRPPKDIISDNARCFTAMVFQKMMKQLGILWKKVVVMYQYQIEKPNAWSLLSSKLFWSQSRNTDFSENKLFFPCGMDIVEEAMEIDSLPFGWYMENRRDSAEPWLEHYSTACCMSRGEDWRRFLLSWREQDVVIIPYVRWTTRWS